MAHRRDYIECWTWLQIVQYSQRQAGCNWCRVQSPSRTVVKHTGTSMVRYQTRFILSCGFLRIYWTVLGNQLNSVIKLFSDYTARTLNHSDLAKVTWNFSCHSGNSRWGDSKMRHKLGFILLLLFCSGWAMKEWINHKITNCQFVLVQGLWWDSQTQSENVLAPWMHWSNRVPLVNLCYC